MRCGNTKSWKRRVKWQDFFKRARREIFHLKQKWKTSKRKEWQNNLRVRGIEILKGVTFKACLQNRSLKSWIIIAEERKHWNTWTLSQKFPRDEQKFLAKILISELLSIMECKRKGEEKDNRRGNKSLPLNTFSGVAIEVGLHSILSEWITQARILSVVFLKISSEIWL